MIDDVGKRKGSKLSEDELCHAFAEKLKESSEFVAWVSSLTRIV
jgi:hypothetical protein